MGPFVLGSNVGVPFSFRDAWVVLPGLWRGCQKRVPLASGNPKIPSKQVTYHVMCIYVLQERMRENKNVFVNLSTPLHFTGHSTLHVWVRVNLKNPQYLDNTSPHHRVLPPPHLSAQRRQVEIT